MAEQALNTIYVLGDQPDALTSDIIRHMTRRVFGDALEHGDATLLAQLLFVAGHCAVKQLVHLELIEKEFKRRRAEETKATAGKDKDEIEQVAGSVEDDIGDAIAHAREREIMHAPNSLLSVFGPMSAAVVSQPKVYKVRRRRRRRHSPHEADWGGCRTRRCRRRRRWRWASLCV